jgi:hypothetical protein
MVPTVVMSRIRLVPEQLAFAKTDGHEPAVIYPNGGRVTVHSLVFEFGENE